MSDIEEIADGFALWEEHKPQSGEDWLAVAGRVLADGGAENPSPLFAGLLLAQERTLVLEQTVRMLMRELAQYRDDTFTNRHLEAAMAQARRALHGEPMP